MTMDFVARLPKAKTNHDTIRVIVDRLTKSAYFLPINEKYTIEKLVHLYLKKNIIRHGVPVSMVLDYRCKVYLKIFEKFSGMFRN